MEKTMTAATANLAAMSVILSGIADDVKAAKVGLRLGMLFWKVAVLPAAGALGWLAAKFEIISFK